MKAELLSPTLVRRLEQLKLRAGRLARGASRGERRSRARGQSVEFADFRNYVAGDDLRYLDWNLYGRLDRLYLKLYEEEREVPVQVFLDLSESMTFGEPSKALQACRIAAALGCVALAGFDRITISPFPELKEHRALQQALHSVRGKGAALSLIRALEQLTPGGGSSLNETLRRGAIASRQAGLAVVLSDFLDPGGYEAGLTSLAARGFEVCAIQILAPEELEPTAYGDLKLVDAETGSHQEVSFGRFRLKSYQASVETFVQALREFCQKRGMRFLSVNSADPAEELLLRRFREAALWE